MLSSLTRTNKEHSNHQKLRVRLTNHQKRRVRLISKTVPASQNKIKIIGNLHCWKCKSERKGKFKRFDNCRSLFWHLIKHHSGMDRKSTPTLKVCLDMLDVLSVAVSVGVIK